MNGLGLNVTSFRHALDDPFVDYGAGASSFALSATAADYAPVPTTAPAIISAPSLAPCSSSPSTSATTDRPVKSVTVSGSNLASAGTTRYVKIAGPIEDEAGMTRIKDVSLAHIMFAPLSY